MALIFTSLFLKLAKIQIFIPKSAYGRGEGGSGGLGNIPKKTVFLLLLLVDKYIIRSQDPNNFSDSETRCPV